MPRSRRDTFEPQGTRGARFGSRKQISTRRGRKPSELSDKMTYREGVSNLSRMQDMRDLIVDYVDEEVGALWRQLRGGNRDLESADFRLPQSLDPYGRVVKVWDSKSKQYSDVGNHADVTKVNTFSGGTQYLEWNGGELQLELRTDGALQQRWTNTSQSNGYRFRLQNNSKVDSTFDWNDDSNNWIPVWGYNPDNLDFITSHPASEIGDTSLWYSTTLSYGSLARYFSSSGTNETDLNFKYKDLNGNVNKTKIFPPAFACYTKLNNQVTTTAFVTLAGYTEKVDQGGFTPSSGAITVPQTGYYKIDGYVNGSSTTANRSTLYVNVDEDQGSGTWVTIAQQMCYAKRDATNFEGGVAFSVIHQLDEGDVIRLQVKHVGDALTIGTLDAILNIQRIY